MNIPEFAIDPVSYKIQAITCIIIGSLICVLAICSFFRPLFTTTEEQMIELKRLDDEDPDFSKLRERREVLKNYKQMNKKL